MITTNVKLFEKLRFSTEGHCVCGRVMSVIHCPSCGSADVRALKKYSKTSAALCPDGSFEKCKTYGCRVCGDPFIESDCFRACHARPLEVVTKKEHEVGKLLHEVPGSQVLLDQFFEKFPHRRPKGYQSQVGKDITEERSPLDIADEERRRSEPPKLDEGGES